MIGIKPSEKIWTTCNNDKSEIVGIITANEVRSTYYLYTVKDNKATKTAYKSGDPRN